MLFATTTSEALYIGDSDDLRKTATALPPCFDLIDKPISSCWCPTTTDTLDLCSTTTVYRYNATTNQIKDVYTARDAIHCIATRDASTVFVGEGAKIQVLSGVETGRGWVSATFEVHRAPVTALSLSGDCTLLASSSSTAVYVHALGSGGTATALRGVNHNGSVGTCAFHAHGKGRLLVGVGRCVVVYETGRSAGPVKTVVLGEGGVGDVVVIASSPFSKSLVAAATSDGYVYLLDLDKEKGLSKTINLKTPLTSLDFSPEGGAIFVGTETGKVLVIQLRALDKSPRVVTIGSSSRIETISVQRKPTPKPVGETTPKLNLSASSKAAAERRAVLARKPVASPRPSRTAVPPSTTPNAHKRPSVKETVIRKSPNPKRTVSSTARKGSAALSSPEGISVEMDTIGTRHLAVSKSPLRPRLSPAGSKTSTSSKAKVTTTSPTRPVVSRRPDSASTASGSRKSPTILSGISPRIRSSSTTLVVPGHDGSRTGTRPRTGSSASKSSTKVIVTSTPPSRPTSSAAASSSRPSSSRETLSLPPSSSRTSSPELPNVIMEVLGSPLTPMKSKRQEMSTLGVGVPDGERWLGSASKEGILGKGKGKGKSVGFDNVFGRDEEDKENRGLSPALFPLASYRDLSMQVSPRRGSPTPSAAVAATSWTPSPLRQPAGVAGGLSATHPRSHVPSYSTTDRLGGVGVGGGPAGTPSSAHDLLKSIVKDVMFDYRRETRSDIEGLHLDLLRMGRSWKAELRTLMDEYVGDLGELREENRRLREENERLRRVF